MKVSLDEVDGNTEKMIKKFLKKTKKMRIIEDCFDRRYYVKPSAKRNQERRSRMRALEKEKAAQPKEEN
jgi:ribosomal protein S21